LDADDSLHGALELALDALKDKNQLLRRKTAQCHTVPTA
jgi:hypothetical protein